LGTSTAVAWELCWGDSESSLSYTKSKRVFLAAQIHMRKAQ
jgi:hypothetical protein